MDIGSLIVFLAPGGTFLIIIIDQAAAAAAAVVEIQFAETVAKAQGDISRLEGTYTTLIEGRTFQFVLELEEFLEGLAYDQSEARAALHELLAGTKADAAIRGTCSLGDR